MVAPAPAPRPTSPLVGHATSWRRVQVWLFLMIKIACAASGCLLKCATILLAQPSSSSSSWHAIYNIRTKRFAICHCHCLLLGIQANCNTISVIYMMSTCASASLPLSLTLFQSRCVQKQLTPHTPCGALRRGNCFRSATLERFMRPTSRSPSPSPSTMIQSAVGLLYNYVLSTKAAIPHLVGSVNCNRIAALSVDLKPDLVRFYSRL